MAPKEKPRRSLAQAIRLRLRLTSMSPDAFGSERSFDPPIGRNWSPGEGVRGFYIDFSPKLDTPVWPPFWFRSTQRHYAVAIAQWGLGAYERFLNGEGEAWLECARGAAGHLLEHQHRGGSQDGGWRHLQRMPHTYSIDPPWLSAIAQGEGASLLVRLHLETGEERYAEAALQALKPMSVPTSEGGTRASLAGSPFVEEYPTDPPSCVLNGAIFALWGYHDVGLGLRDAEVTDAFESLTTALASNLWQYDTGYWSRYDLYPHPVPNVASPAYHLLHIKQLRLLDQLSPRAELEPAAARFEAYRASRRRRTEALGHKVAFRLLVPRNPVLAHRLPWNSVGRARRREPKSDTLVLCYHAVSPDWQVPLSVTPDQLSDHLEYLADRGYRGVTFSEAVGGGPAGKVVAVTFDDGFRSVFELARPILERLGIPGTAFLPTEFVDREQPLSWPGIDEWVGGEHDQELRPMSWEQARALAGAGWEIGSHTRSHPRLTELSDDELEEELAGSRRECERMLEGPCLSLAFPYGDHDARVLAAAGAAGYSAAGTLPSANTAPMPLAWPRIGIYHVDGARSFRLKVSPTVRRLRRTRAWAPLTRGAQSLRRAPPEAKGRVTT